MPVWDSRMPGYNRPTTPSVHPSIAICTVCVVGGVTVAMLVVLGVRLDVWYWVTLYAWGLIYTMWWRPTPTDNEIPIILCEQSII